MWIPGCAIRSLARIGGSRIAAWVSLAAMQIVPSIDCDWPAAASNTRLAASPIARTCSSSSSPPGGERESPPDALEEDDAELLLERVDLPAQGGLRHPERPRRR